MRLLIFGPDGKLLRELEQVTRAHVTRPGALVCDLAPGAPMQRWVAAPGVWHHVEEWRDLVAVGVAPAMPDGFLTPHALAGSMTEQMAIICNCTDQRCPITLTPPSTNARAWWRALLTRSTAEVAAGASPFRRCALERGHDGEHVWPEDGQWPYGIHNHHPHCPRHPRPAAVEGEGQPTDDAPPAGLTPAPEQPAQQPDAFPDFEHGTGYPEPEPPSYSWAIEGGALAVPESGAAQIARPFVTAEVQVLPKPAHVHPDGPVHSAGRRVWGACAVMREGRPREEFCELAPGHHGRHATNRGGERRTW